MQRFFYTLIWLSVLFSCQNSNTNIELQDTHPSFNLSNDYLNLTQKLTEGDTVLFLADLSICTYEAYEVSLIYKLNNEIYLQTNRMEPEVSIDQAMGPVKLDSSRCSDSLSIDSLIRLLHANNKDLNTHYRFALVYQKDTIKFFSYGLSNASYLASKYSIMMSCNFPNERNYQTSIDVIPPN